MKFNEQEKEMIKDFFDTFHVVVFSMASQIYSINPDLGTEHYDSTEVNGATELLEIYYDDHLVYSVENPSTDKEEVLKFIKAWDENERKIPEFVDCI